MPNGNGNRYIMPEWVKTASIVLTFIIVLVSVATNYANSNTMIKSNTERIKNLEIKLDRSLEKISDTLTDIKECVAKNTANSEVLVKHLDLKK